MEVPRTLRAWFVAHALVDLGAGLPLLAAPELVLRRLGWTCVDPVSARLVGAALLAIGGQRDDLSRHALDATLDLARLEQALAERGVRDELGREHVDELSRSLLRGH